LKIFTGCFDDAALDVNIKGMGEERMKYPLAYGYSLVGRVIECGCGVEHPDALLGKRVFTFSAHASQVIAGRSAIQLVPDDIDALDAIFVPSVETALSLIQDAGALFGEKIAVFGQGLIGLLVTALLRQHAVYSLGRFGTVSTFDTLPDRLAASAAMGAAQALFPTESSRLGPFDLVIEVSGNSRALQSAIDSIHNGGRIVIGSWYGKDNILLKLGIDFHRSHKTIKALQVSEIPAEMCKTWTKERRFALTWELVKCIRPSRLITRRVSLDRAQDAYNALEKGDKIVVAFDYR
jgi:threonine dehydrogenase-like Zn-dependent dehydrogenase